MYGRGLGLLAVATLAAGAWGWASHASRDTTETITFSRPPATTAPALCPWRQSQSDLRAFFPTADRYETRMMALSGLRLAIQQRLGPDASLEYNSLPVFPVFRGQTPQGVVLIQRAKAEYGEIEVVVGVDEAGRVLGVRIQRLREPEKIAQAITDPAWLHAFRSKTAEDAWRLGVDIPDRPAPARATAQIVARTVRSLLIENDVVRHPKKREN